MVEQSQVRRSSIIRVKSEVPKPESKTKYSDGSCNVYISNEVVGRGSQGEVRVAYTNKYHVGEKFAAKIIDIKEFAKNRVEIENEINIHRQLSLTGCVPRFYSVCKAQNAENVIVRTELCD
jgi:serine/threonine protein kinase